MFIKYTFHITQHRELLQPFKNRFSDVSPRVERRINSYLNSWPTCHLTAFAPSGAAPCSRSSTSRPSHPGISLIKARTSLPSSATTPPARLPLRLRLHQRALRSQIADNSLIFPSESESEWVPCASSRQPCSPPVRVQRAGARTQTGKYSGDSLNRC